MPDPPIKLVAFDMEGCLTADPTVWEVMHRKLGTWHSHGLPYWERYCAGRLGYDEFARMDVAVWRGAPAELLREAAAQVPLRPGCAGLLRALEEGGVEVAVISNGLLCVAERFSRDFGARHVQANRALAAGGRLTGELEVLMPYAGKGRALAQLRARRGLSRAEVAAVGDSPSDVAMFREARLGIAFRPSHPCVAEGASHVVDGEDLAPLLDLLL